MKPRTDTEPGKECLVLQAWLHEQSQHSFSESRAAIILGKLNFLQAKFNMNSPRKTTSTVNMKSHLKRYSYFTLLILQFLLQWALKHQL